MLYSQELYQKLDKLKDKMVTLQDKGEIDAAHAMIPLIKDMKKQIEIAEAEEDEGKASAKDPDDFINKENGLGIKAVAAGESLKKAFVVENGNLDLGKYIKGCILGDWSGAPKEMSVKNALSTSGGKVIIPQELSRDILDLARNQSALKNVPIIPMDTDNLTFAKITGNDEFGFKKELDKATYSNFAFEGVELKSKTLYGLVKCSLELVKSARNLEEVLKSSMAKAVAAAMDKAFLLGAENVGLKGILQDENINKITSENIDYLSLIKAMGAISKNNGVASDIVYNSDIQTTLLCLQDGNGQFLDAPIVIDALDTTISNNVPGNKALVFNKNAIAIGMQNKIVVDFNEALGYEDGSVIFRVWAMVDVALLQPQEVTEVTFTTTEPGVFAGPARNKLNKKREEEIK